MSNVVLSIIIPSFNTKIVLEGCLNSIHKYTKNLKYEIILIENGSKDGSLQYIKEYKKTHPEVILIDAGENLGFGKANNLGAKKASGEYLLFLNSDTLLFDNALKEAVDDVKNNTKTGIYSCRLLNSDKSIQASGGHFPNLINLYAWQLFIDDLPIIGTWIPSFHPQKSAYDKDRQMDWVTGAFMIIPKKVFDEVGGFDENIFMYTEEMELSYRLKNLGYINYLKKSPSIIHLGGASGGSYLALTSEVKNMLYFWKKHFPSWQYPFAKFAFILGSLLRWLLFGIIKGDEKARRIYSDVLGSLI